MYGSTPHRTKTTRTSPKGGGSEEIRRKGSLEKFQYYFVSGNCSVGIFSRKDLKYNL